MSANKPITKAVHADNFQYPLCPHCGAEIKGVQTMETPLGPRENIRIYYCCTCNVLLGMDRIIRYQNFG